MAASLNQRINDFWNSARGKEPQQLRTELEQVLAGEDPQTPRVLFEIASLHDYLGEEQQAVPAYRSALDCGLAGAQHDEALLQLASTLRNLGELEESISLLRRIGSGSPIFTDAQAFLALALHDVGRRTDAIEVAVQALARHSSLYGRAIESYVLKLRSPAPNAGD